MRGGARRVQPPVLQGAAESRPGTGTGTATAVGPGTAVGCDPPLAKTAWMSPPPPQAPRLWPRWSPRPLWEP